MWYHFFLFSVTFIGLASVFAALIVLWRRESWNSLGWLGSRQGLGTLFVLTAGAGLFVGAQFELVSSYPYQSPLVPGSSGVLSLRTTALPVVCLVLLAIGASLLVVGGPSKGRRAPHGNVPFVGASAVALIFTVAELSVFEQARVVERTPERIPAAKLVAADDPGRKTPTHKFPTYQKKYHFRQGTENFFGQHVPVWTKALDRYKGKPGVNYLEVGLFEGQSLLWMLENILTHPTARATGIDPFSDPIYASKDSKTYKEILYSNLNASGSEDKARIIEGYSQTELRKLPLESFDIIYIDGSHNSADVLEDAILSWRLLKDGGVLIFDDYLLHPGMTRTIDTFYDIFSERFERLHIDRQVLMRKKPADGSSVRPWR
jgi:predicted O-methyltransferase YrrM